MRIEYGHVKAEFQGEQLMFIPSLENISNIGTPKEIADALFSVMYADTREWLESHTAYDTEVYKAVRRKAGQDALRAAVLILTCCCDRDCSKLVGSYNGKFYRPGKENVENIISLAQIMMIHGVIGKTTSKTTNEGRRRMKEFSAKEFAELARVHLGLSRDEAWQLTMTEWVSLMEAKFPDRKEAEQPTYNLDRKEYDKHMKRAKEIKERLAAKRAMNNG